MPSFALSEFEEKEFEAPLYNQMEQGSRYLWSPGQVFENCIGIDRASFIRDNYFWEINGLNSISPGIRLEKGGEWSFIWRRRQRKKKLPDFKLNLFTQAKRPSYSTKVNKKLWEFGIKGKAWKFSIDEEQQKTLIKLANKIGNKGLVIYASPCFHRQSDLYLHTRKASIVANSTFPDVGIFKGHKSWIYNKPGAEGAFNPEFEKSESESLATRIERLLFQDNSEPNYIATLTELRETINSVVLNDSDIQESFLRGLYAEEIRTIDYKNETHYYTDSERDYLKVLKFTEIFKLSWFVVGKSVDTNE